MAFCGASTPIIAKYNVDTDTYSDGMVLAKLVSTNINPTYKEGSLAADDDSQAEYDKNFSYAAVDAEIDTLPVEAGKIMFGYQVSTGAGEDKDEITFGGDDQANYIGYGIVVRQKVHGEASYVAIWLKKVLFTLSEENYTTAGDNITFTGNKISGRATITKNRKWRSQKTFTTLEEAIAYLKTKANITESV